MDISNSLASSILTNSVKSGHRALSEKSQNQEPSNKQLVKNNEHSPALLKTNNTNPELLARKSDEIQQSRIQRDNVLDLAPKKTQQAVNSYQQTIEASKSINEGELVGVDLFV